MASVKCLVLGCGNKRDSSLGEMTYLDSNPDCKPDVVWDLTKHPLPFKDETFDSIIAVHVLEHLAYQGDADFFFKEFQEYWRILKPKGHFTGICPSDDSPWVWGDPGHKRVIQKETIFFLDLDNYNTKTMMCDYRNIYKGNFKVISCGNKDTNFMFTLEKKNRI